MKKIVLILLLIANIALADGYKIRQSVINTGGKSSGGSYVLYGSLEQQMVGFSTGGSYQVSSGFWKGWSSLVFDKPIVSTTAATNRATTSVTLSANLTAIGGAAITERGIIYGTSSGLSTSIGTKVIIAGTSTGIYSTFPSGLDPETKYYHNAYAINSFGTGYGTELSFYTFSLEPLSHPSSFNATASGNTSVILDFTAASTITNADGYLIVRGTINSYNIFEDGVAPASLSLSGAVIVADISSTSTITYTETSLAANTNYTYTIIPYNWDGSHAETINYKIDGSVKNDFVTTGLPIVSTGTTNQITNNSLFVINNNVVNNGSTMSNHGSVWGTSANPVLSTSNYTSLGASTGSYQSYITGLNPETHYYVRSFATNEAGTVYGSDINFYTLSNEPAAHPAAFTSTPNGNTDIVLNFSAASTITDADGYIILRSTSLVPDYTSFVDGTAPGSLNFGTSTFVTNISSTSTLTYTDLSLTPNTTYYYLIVPYNWDGTNSATYNYKNISSKNTFATTGLPVSTTGTIGVGSFFHSSTAATIVSNQVSNSGSNNIDIGLVYGTSANQVKGASNFVSAGSSNNSTYSSSLSSLNPETKYYFNAYATNSAGTVYGTESSFYTYSTEPSSFPTTFTLTPSGNSSVIIDFSAASTITNADGYLIFRSTDNYLQNSILEDGLASGALTLGTQNLVVNITNSSTTTYTDQSLTPNTTYYYAIVPYNWDGVHSETYNYLNSGSTKTGYVVTGLPVATTGTLTTDQNFLTSTRAIIVNNNISNQSSFVTDAGIVYGTSPNPTISNTKYSIGAQNNGSFMADINTLVPNTTYYFRAYATNAAGTAYGSGITYTTPCQSNIEVTNTNDAGVGSLRYAIAGSCAGDTVRFNSSLSGQTITLTSGQISIAKNLTIDASSLTNQVKIDGNSNSRIFYIENSTVNLNKLKLQNGNESNSFGGAIWSVNSIIRSNNSTFASNTAKWGGAISQYDDDGGLVASLSLTSCDFTSNSASGGEGGAYNQADGSSSFTNCTFTSNSSTSNGGAVYADKGAFTYTGLTFTSNTSDLHGAAIATGNNNSSTLSLTNSTLTSNHCTSNSSQGGAIHINGTTNFTITGSTFDANYLNNSSSNYGAGIFVNTNTSLTLSSTTVKNNYGANDGGGLYMNQARVSLGDSTIFLNNTAKASGGAIFVSQAACSLSVDRSKFGSNVATNGSGAAVFINVGTQGISFTNSEFYSNTANSSRAGAIMADNSATFSMTNCALYSNSSIYGGAIFMDNTSSASIVNTTFKSNSALNGGAILSTETSDLVLTNCTFAENSVSGSGNAGGAILNDPSKNASIKAINTIFTDNTAASGTGPDIYGKITSNDYNLISNTSGATIQGTTTNNITGVSALLSTFDYFNSSFVKAYSLSEASAAINHGTSTQGSHPTGIPSTDYNSFSTLGTKDIGAYEYRIDVPRVSTSSIQNTGENSADGGGQIINIGGSSVNTKGLAYSTSRNPSISGSFSSNSVSNSPFTTSITSGLTAATKYYTRAYATNSQGTGYGLELSFFTLSIEPSSYPTVSASAGQSNILLTFQAASTITNCKGYIILRKQGSIAPDASGISDASNLVQGSLPNGTTLVANITSSSQTSYDDTGLTPANTTFTYIFIPYNWDETNVETKNYKTGGTIPSLSATTGVPEVSTGTKTNFGTTSITITGSNVTSQGGANVTDRGVVWSTSPTPTIANNKTATNPNPSSGTGTYDVNITGLTAGTKYYARAYATSSIATSYGSEITFYTAPATQASNITWGSVTQTSITANWTSGSGANRLVLIKKTTPISTTPLTNETAYTASSAYASGSSVDGGYVIYHGSGSSAPVTGLTRNTLYYFRVFESVGTGTEVVFNQNTATTNPTSRNTNRKTGAEGGEGFDFDILTISPNPASDYIKIDFTLPEEIALNMQIFDLQGNTMFTLNDPNRFTRGHNQQTIDCSNFPSGTYFISMTNGSEAFYYSFVVER